jgi:dTDP-4-amino-4,6-dideoxygalactose transaminase/uncharacterized protein (UPF0276 family)
MKIWRRNRMKNISSKPVRCKKDYLVFGSPAIREEEISEVVDSLKSRWLGTGPKVQRFEEDFRKYVGTDFAIAVNSCTAALHLSMLASGIEPGDEVITTAMTFCATINAIIHAGATPVLADCDPSTFCIDPEDIKRKVTEKTKAIVPVHFGGHACDMDAIMLIAKEHKLKVIEDCAHAVETTYKGRHVGTFGDFGCFSFYVTKNVVTGEGGMVLAKRKADADKIKVLALHGMSQDAWKRFSDDGYKHYQVIYPGFKYNMMDLQAAIGIHQLKRVEDNWMRRREIWDRYQKELKFLPITLPADPPGHIKHGYHLYTILINEEKTDITRDEFLSAMNNENIGIGVHYQSIPTHLYYRRKYDWHDEDYPVSYSVGRRTVSLPLSPALSNGDVADVIKAVKKILPPIEIKIATPISHLFSDKLVADEIASESSCLECREVTMACDKANQHVFHSEKDIIHPWTRKEKDFLNEMISVKKELNLISFHMSVSCSDPVLEEGVFLPGGKEFSRQEMLDNARDNIKWIKQNECMKNIRIAVENNNYYPTAAYRYVTDADFISHVVEDNSIFLLFDLAHARITANNKKEDYDQYVNGLPLRRMIQIHLSKEGVNKKGWAFDEHELPDEEIFDKAKGLIEKYVPEYITVEYYKDKHKLIKAIAKCRELCSK